MNKTIRWAAELPHVREVSLLGTADLAFWRERLQKEDLLPAERDGRAQVLMIAAAARYMGLRFQELSFSILISRQQTATWQEGAFLLQAFNSNRFFALTERLVFSTPYDHGLVRTSVSLPASIDLFQNGERVFAAEMAHETPAREPPRQGANKGWEGPVFLPATRPARDGQKKVFVTRLRGETEVFPFDRAKDSLTIRPSRGSEVLQSLLDSNFVVEEWIVRRDATHSKSKTYRRADVLGDEKAD
jgi:hypothetical protein